MGKVAGWSIFILFISMEDIEMLWSETFWHCTEYELFQSSYSGIPVVAVLKELYTHTDNTVPPIVLQYSPVNPLEHSWHVS